MNWFATHSAGILRGSLSAAPDTIQIIWVKFMAMANEAKNPESGRLEFAKGQPYSMDYIAMICRKPVQDVEAALASFRTDLSQDGTPRVTVEPDGTVVLNNWAKYQDRNKPKSKSNVDTSTGEIKDERITLDSEHKEKQGQVMAYKLAKKYPDDAEKGLKAVEFENHIKDGIKDAINS
jgi:hypothetical protein